MQDDALFIDVFSNQSPLIKRLARACGEAAREFAENPREYIATAFKDHAAGGARRKDLLRFGMALGIAFYALLFAGMLIVWTLHARHGAGADDSVTAPIYRLSSLPPPESQVNRDKDQHGGGGGGNHELTPATQGTPPPFDTTQIIAPTTKPTINPPVLAVEEVLKGDPLQNVKRDDFATGLPVGAIGPPSDGPGDSGIGTGKKGGVGPGDGGGLGRGHDGGQGDDGYNGPGGRRAAEVPTKVDRLPVALNQPRPNYTEAARGNKVQGVIRARILIGSDGLVKQVRIVRGLPDGLDEEAIRVAMMMRFQPAMKNSVAVAYWMTLDVEFNLR
jgi:TonB family protein